MKCNKCNGELTVDTSMVLTSNPPQYACYCETCNSVNYIQCDKYRSYLWEVRAYSPAGNVLDKTLNEVKGDETEMTKGWICPKCGKVFSPNITECSYCNNKTAK